MSYKFVPLEEKFRHGLNETRWFLLPWFENETSLRFPFWRLEIAFRVNEAKFWFFDYLAYFPEHKNVTIGPLGEIIDTIQSPHTLCSLGSLAQEITVYMYDIFCRSSFIILRNILENMCHIARNVSYSEPEC